MKSKLTIALVGLALAFTSACGADGSTDSSTPNNDLTDPKLAAMLPQDIQDSGVIDAASSFTTPPLYTFEKDGKTASGVLVQLIENAAAHLGIEVSWSQIPYAGLVPALQSGKIDITGSQFSSTDKNKQSTNIVSLYKNTVALVIPADQKDSYSSLADACGKNFAGPLGSTIEDAALDLINAECGADDQSKMTRFDSAPAALTALKADRVDGYFLSLASASYTASQSPNDFAVAFDGDFILYNSGFAVDQDNVQLAEAFVAAINATMEDGTYQEIMEKWDMPSTLFSTEALLNGPDVAVAP